MSCAKPCIATDIQSLKEIIDSKKDGLLFRVGDAEDLNKKISCLIKNKTLMKSLGKNARKRIIKNNSIKNVVDKIEKLYSDIK